MCSFLSKTVSDKNIPKSTNLMQEFCMIGIVRSSRCPTEPPWDWVFWTELSLLLMSQEIHYEYFYMLQISLFFSLLYCRICWSFWFWCTIPVNESLRNFLGTLWSWQSFLHYPSRLMREAFAPSLLLLRTLFLEGRSCHHCHLVKYQRSWVAQHCWNNHLTLISFWGFSSGLISLSLVQKDDFDGHWPSFVIWRNFLSLRWIGWNFIFLSPKAFSLIFLICSKSTWILNFCPCVQPSQLCNCGLLMQH